MECPKCQSQVNEGSKFCHICGTPLTGADTYTSGNGAETPEADNASAVNQYDGQPAQQEFQQQENQQQENQQQEYQQQEYQQQEYPQQEFQQQEFQKQENQQQEYQQQEYRQGYQTDGAAGNAEYMQQYQQFQNRNSRYVSPNKDMQPQYNNIGAPVNQKKSANVIPIIAVIAAAVLIIAGIVAGIIIFFSALNNSSRVIDDFTKAVNTRDASVLAPDLFSEASETLNISQITSLFSSLPEGQMIEHTIIDTDTYNKNDLQASGYASALYNSYPSIGTFDNVEERAVHTVKFNAANKGLNDSAVLYFDVVKVSGHWKIAEINTSKSSLYDY